MTQLLQPVTGHDYSHLMPFIGKGGDWTASELAKATGRPYDATLHALYCAEADGLIEGEIGKPNGKRGNPAMLWRLVTEAPK